ncbi:MAG: radical SAM protein, partial [Saprospiraceae bacterium]
MSFPSNSEKLTRILTGWRYRLLELKMLHQLWTIARQAYPQRSLAWRALRRHIAVHLEYQRICHLTKGVRFGGRIFIQMTFPRLGTAAMKILARNELHRQLPIPDRRPGLNVLVLAITKKCSLQCAHCFEWDALNGREQLSIQDVLTIIHKFQTDGVATIELSGGEPLNRFDDLLQILHESDTQASDFWLLSSGYRLPPQRAQALAAAGLVGLGLSLDHWDSAAHDRFRGLPGSFDWVRQAAHNAHAAGLAVCLTLTAVREFCTPEHLWTYARLARDWEVAFIRILEPRALGHFAGQAVELGSAEIAVLEEFVRKMQR